MDRVICVILCIAVMVVAIFVMAYCGNPPAEATAEPTTMPTVEKIVQVEPEPTEETTMATEPPVVLYDAPLEEELQMHIISEADEHGIDPAIIIAMAYKESTYRADAIGDSGNSYGLLQVQPRWHYARMQKLGCTDLLDPYQNVTVAVDYLCELLNRYGSIDTALTAYNQGHYNGTVTQYAKTILAHAEKLNNERSQ